MRVLETKIYTIEEHPNKNKCFDYIRENRRKYILCNLYQREYFKNDYTYRERDN